MLRVKYLFTSVGSAGHPIPFDENATLPPDLIKDFVSEGFCYMWSRMLDLGIVDDVEVVMESARFPGLYEFTPKFRFRVVPHINQFFKHIEPDDIIFVRGGFKSWFPCLQQWKKEQKWVLFYQAATNRGVWQFWDVVFNDLVSENGKDRYGRFHLAFKKPTHPSFFKPMEIPRDFDICVGASHIHDKKGQWKVIRAIQAYERRYGKALNAVMPGRMYHGTSTNLMVEDIQAGKVSRLTMPGMVSRLEVGKILNRSKLFVHVGGAGQNDRGVLESMACGTPVMLANTQYHAPFTFKTPLSFVTLNSLNPEALAVDIHNALEVCTEERRVEVKRYFEDESSVEAVILPAMWRLFKFLRANPKADREALWREYGVL